MLIATHEMQFAKEVADRIVFMDAGRIVEMSEPQSFFSQPKCDRWVLTPQEAVAIEPALTQAQMVGATYTAADESGDAHQFTQRLAERCAQNGVG